MAHRTPTPPLGPYLIRHAKRGDVVWVRYGRNGRQLAVVAGVPEGGTSAPRVVVQKWRAVSRRWTQAIWASQYEILGWVNPGEKMLPAAMRALPRAP